MKRADEGCDAGAPDPAYGSPLRCGWTEGGGLMRRLDPACGSPFRRGGEGLSGTAASRGPGGPTSQAGAVRCVALSTGATLRLAGSAESGSVGWPAGCRACSGALRGSKYARSLISTGGPRWQLRRAWHLHTDGVAGGTPSRHARAARHKSHARHTSHVVRGDSGLMARRGWDSGFESTGRLRCKTYNFLTCCVASRAGDAVRRSPRAALPPAAMPGCRTASRVIAGRPCRGPRLGSCSPLPFPAARALRFGRGAASWSRGVKSLPVGNR